MRWSEPEALGEPTRRLVRALPLAKLSAFSTEAACLRAAGSGRNKTAVAAGRRSYKAPVVASWTSAVVAVVVLALVSWASAAEGEAAGPRVYPEAAVTNARTDYGAVPSDGRGDTEALRRAICENVGTAKMLYLPAGIYQVSGTLAWKNCRGAFQVGLVLAGAGEGHTTIRLDDSAPGFGNPRSPRAVIYTASSLIVRPGAAFDHARKGEGNEAFRNYVEDLTVDTGNNRGAVGVDYLANNWGAIRHVTVRGNGYAGIRMERKWPGPALIQNVSVFGFDYGVRVAHPEYSVTIEHLSLSGQRVAGVRNHQNVLAIRDLKSVNRVPALTNEGAGGLVTLKGGRFTGGAGGAAIRNSGGLYAEGISASGYAQAISGVAGTSVTSYASARRELFPSARRSLGLPVAETPKLHDNNLSHWANIADYGARPGDSRDDRAAIQRAIDSGATTVYFPKGGGAYRLSGTVEIRGKVQRIFGNHAVVGPLGSYWASGEKPLFRATGARPVSVERLLHRPLGKDVSGMVVYQQATRAALVMKDLACPALRPWVKYCYKAAPGAGPLFVENVRGNPYYFSGGQSVWARQLNLEGENLLPAVVNDASKLWVLGTKTEGPRGIIASRNSASTEVLGGLVYPVVKVPRTVPAFVDAGSEVSYSYATSAYGAGRNYATHVTEARRGMTRNLTAPLIPARGRGSMLPLFSGHN